MKNLLSISPEISSIFGNLYTRHDITNNSITVFFKHWTFWDLDTEQVEISKSLIHFSQKDGEIVGVKCFSAMGDQQ